jgi:hypothetical protein
MRVARSPYEFVHMNAYHTATVAGNEVVVNFDTVNETGDTVFLRGSAVDEYGWWHRELVVDLHRVDGMERFRGRIPEPETAPFSVDMRFEWRRGLIRLVVPDEVAARLKTWTREHWHEFVGMGDGYSDSAEPGTWEHRALAYLHSIQSHLRDPYVFIEGESFIPNPEKLHRNYELFVTTSGVRHGRVPTAGFYFSG